MSSLETSRVLVDSVDLSKTKKKTNKKCEEKEKMTKITSSLMFFLYLYLPSYDSFEIKKTEEKKITL